MAGFFEPASTWLETQPSFPDLSLVLRFQLIAPSNDWSVGPPPPGRSAEPGPGRSAAPVMDRALAIGRPGCARIRSVFVRCRFSGLKTRARQALMFPPSRPVCRSGFCPVCSFAPGTVPRTGLCGVVVLGAGSKPNLTFSSQPLGLDTWPRRGLWTTLPSGLFFLSIVFVLLPVGF